MRKWRRMDPSRTWQGFRDAPAINPFSKYQWISNPYPDYNMPTVARDAQPHHSLKAVSHLDEKGWFHVIDAKGRNVGRLSTFICKLLMGKHRVDFRNCRPMGDSVIVVNAIHQFFPGHTWDTKIYRFYRGRKTDPRGPKIITATRLMMLNPGIILSMAVKRMLPNTYMRSNWLRKFYCYPGAIHPHWGIPQVVVPTENRPVQVRDAFSVDAPAPPERRGQARRAWRASLLARAPRADVDGGGGARATSAS